MDSIFSDSHVVMAGSSLGAILLFVLRQVWKSAVREKLLKLGIEVAYSVVNDVSKMTETKVDDKVAVGLGALRDWMAAHGEEVKPEDEAKAKLLWSAMHGEGK